MEKARRGRGLFSEDRGQMTEDRIFKHEMGKGRRHERGKGPSKGQRADDPPSLKLWRAGRTDGSKKLLGISASFRQATRAGRQPVIGAWCKAF